MTKENKNTLYCSFCGKSQHEVRKLIAGPTVFICDQGVDLKIERTKIQGIKKVVVLGDFNLELHACVSTVAGANAPLAAARSFAAAAATSSGNAPPSSAATTARVRLCTPG